MRLMGRAGWGVLAGVVFVLLGVGFSADALDVPPLIGRVIDVARILPPRRHTHMPMQLQR